MTVVTTLTTQFGLVPYCIALRTSATSVVSKRYVSFLRQWSLLLSLQFPYAFGKRAYWDPFLLAVYLERLVKEEES